MKRTMTILLLMMGLLCPAAAQEADSLLIMFWNVENFFDPVPDGASPSELEFSSTGARRWSRRRFYTKCNAVAKTMLAVADRCGRLPDAVGLVEVENGNVLKKLCGSTMLRRLDYSYVHYESPDHRGIDCGLLYRRSTLSPVDSKPCHLYDSSGAVMATRDILLVRFDSFSVLVNHHPSKVGSGGGRDIAMDRMNGICDSLETAGFRRVLCVGDFNDDVWHGTARTEGTIKYNGAWEKIDGHFARGFSRVREEIMDLPFLLTEDSAFGGMKPLRTYSGPRYLGGVSDHLPIVVTVYF